MPNVPLFERCRPKTWAGVVGQAKALRTIETLRKRGLGGRAYWISGKSGTGKTTIARLLAHEIADDVEEIDAQVCNKDRTSTLGAIAKVIEWGNSPLEWVRKSSHKAWIINEAHRLSDNCVTDFLTLLEPESGLPSTVAIIFTTTGEAQESLFDAKLDAHPFLSRCVELGLTCQGLAKPFAELAKRIAESEGLDGRPLEQYVRLVQDNKNNLRAVLQKIDAGAMISE